MRIVVASQGLDVAPWFMHCESFTSYRVEQGIIIDCQNMPNLSLSAKQLAHHHKELETTVVLAKQMESSAKKALEEAGIETVEGANGTASGAARSYLQNTLAGLEEELEIV